MKKTNNKGFSLVELIVVVAIMAVLIGVLAPQYLKYVEKSRLQKDNQTLGEIANSIKIACSEEAINQEVAGLASGTAVYTVAYGTPAALTSAPAAAKLDAELLEVLGNVALSSNTYKSTSMKIKVTVNTKGVVTVETDGDLWHANVGDTAVKKTF